MTVLFCLQGTSASLQKLLRELVSEKNAEELPLVSFFYVCFRIDIVLARDNDTYMTRRLSCLLSDICLVLIQIVESLLRKLKEEFERKLQEQNKLVSLMFMEEFLFGIA